MLTVILGLYSVCVWRREVQRRAVVGDASFLSLDVIVSPLLSSSPLVACLLDGSTVGTVICDFRLPLSTPCLVYLCYYGSEL